MAKKPQETLCAHAQRQEATAVSECKKLSRVQFSLHYTLCSFVLPLPFIYLYPFPHALTAEQQHHSFPSLSLSLSPHFRMPRVEENTPTVYLALHSACTAQHKSTFIKVKKPSLRFQPAITRAVG